MPSRDWNAASYDRIGGPMTEMAASVLERLDLKGDELVLDAGCGTGRVTELIVERLPRGRVVAVDASAEMVEVARANLGDRARVIEADLVELELEDSFDVVFSTATFHWIHDHDRLFARLFALLRPGGHLIAQCGGSGNIEALRSLARQIEAEERFAPYFESWTPPWHYATPEETDERLRAAGFVDVRSWLEPRAVVPDDPREYLSSIVLGAQVQRLPEDLREAYLDAVLEQLEEPITFGYVRLNIEARRPD